MDWAADASSGIERFGRGPVDLIVLDLNLPDIDGLEVCAQVRAHDRLTPIMMLTARATKQDVVRGLELGADDYLTKPFDTLELIARVRALLRRAEAYRSQGSSADQSNTLERGALSIDVLQRTVRISSRLIELTAKEFELLLQFARNPGRAFTRDELMGRVWGDGFEGYEHTVNTPRLEFAGIMAWPRDRRRHRQATREDAACGNTLGVGTTFFFSLPIAETVEHGR